MQTMKILLPIDGSESSLDAVRYALRLRQAGLMAEHVLVAVQEPVYLVERLLPPDADVLERVSGAVGARALAGAEALLVAAGVTYEREIVSGEPAAAIVETAVRAGCEAIIMGARGRGPVRGALLGSVSHQVLQQAPMAVTIVRSRPPGAMRPGASDAPPAP
jgi:nucleotide-binding universal stress UspA family protein